jgi:hypothetical protein
MKLHSLLAFAFCAILAPLTARTAPPADDSSTLTTALTSTGSRIIIEAHGIQQQAPLFFTASAEQGIRLAADEISGETKLTVTILQGRPEVITLGLSGDGEITSIDGDSGSRLVDWSVRQAGDKRFLDLRPQLEKDHPSPTRLTLTIHTRLQKPPIPGVALPLLFTTGSAASFTSQINLTAAPEVDFRVTAAAGLLPLETAHPNSSAVQFTSSGDATLRVTLSQRGSAIPQAELLNPQLTGTVSAMGNHGNLGAQYDHVDFRFTCQARVTGTNVHLPLLSGRAALTSIAAGDGWHVELTPAMPSAPVPEENRLPRRSRGKTISSTSPSPSPPGSSSRSRSPACRAISSSTPRRPSSPLLPRRAGADSFPPMAAHRSHGNPRAKPPRARSSSPAMSRPTSASAPGSSARPRRSPSASCKARCPPLTCNSMAPAKCSASRAQTSSAGL